MKGRLIALDQIAGRKAAAMVVDGQLDDLIVDASDVGAPMPGTIFRAVCDRPLKGQGGMIVRLPGGTGFLRGAKGMRPGDSLLVQVTGRAEPGKAVPVTAKVLFKSRYAILTPGAPGLNLSRAIRDENERLRLHDIAAEAMGEREAGLILRSACAGADARAIASDIAATGDLAGAIMADGEGGELSLLLDGPDAHLLAWRDWPEPDRLDDAEGAFARHGINDMIDAVRRSALPLHGGFLAFVEPTRAFVAIDVNTGADTSPAAGLKANIAMARTLPRALRCRGLGGQIVVDFAPMPKRDRRQVEHTLRAAFRADPVETALVGWTALGHFELQRKRERVPLHEALR